MYNPLAPNPTTLFPSVSFNSPLDTPNVTSLEMVPFTSRNVATPSHILHPVPVDSIDVNMSSAADSNDDRGSLHDDTDMLVDDDTFSLDAPRLAQTEESGHSRHGRYDNDSMGLARVLNDVMARNSATSVRSASAEESEEQQDEEEPDNEESDEEESDEKEPDEEETDNEEPDDPPSMPESIRRSSRIKRKVKATGETGKSVVPIGIPRPRHPKNSAVVVSDSVNEVDAAVNPLQSAWEQLEDDIFVCFFSVVLLFVNKSFFSQIWTPEITFKNQTRKVLSTERMVTAWGPSKEDKLQFKLIAHDSVCLSHLESISTNTFNILIVQRNLDPFGVISRFNRQKL